MRSLVVLLCMTFIVVFSGQAAADFIIYPNGDAEFGKILSEDENSIEFQFGCVKTGDNVKKIIKKDLLNSGPHPYCQWPPQVDTGPNLGK